MIDVICRNIAEQLIRADRKSLTPFIKETDHPIDFGYRSKDLGKLLSTQTILPEMVEFINRCDRHGKEWVGDQAREILAKARE